MNFSHTITIKDIELYPIASAEGVSPQMAIGSMPVRPALLLRVTDTDDCFGWGEVWANFPPRAHVHKAHIIDDVINPVVQNLPFTEPQQVQQWLREKLSIYFLHVGQPQVFEHILAGLDTALWDLTLRKHNVSAMQYFNVGERVACYASSINASDLNTVIPMAAERGQRHFKIKVGFQDDNGCSLVQRAAELCPDNARLMIDSNQSWTLAQAQSSLQALEQYSLYFAEESLPANSPLSDWEALAKSTSIPLAGGENIYGLSQFLAMADAGLT
ncbi:MAG: enolase C-terminal domain-like protein, partial [Pseudomonadota bacterium]